MSMKEHKIKIAKREFPLAFSLRTLAKIQEKHPDVSVENIEDMFQTVPGLLEMLYLLAEQGARNEGRKLDVDEEWFGSNLPANLKRIVSIRLVVLNTVVDGMHMEAEEEEDADREIDVVLEELKKKKRKQTHLAKNHSLRNDCRVAV